MEKWGFISAIGHSPSTTLSYILILVMPVAIVFCNFWLLIHLEVSGNVGPHVQCFSASLLCVYSTILCLESDPSGNSDSREGAAARLVSGIFFPGGMDESIDLCSCYSGCHLADIGRTIQSWLWRCAELLIVLKVHRQAMVLSVAGHMPQPVWQPCE